MKKLFLSLIITTITLSLYGQHPLLEKALRADLENPLTNIEDLNLESTVWHHFLLGQGNLLEKRWQEFDYFSYSPGTFDYDTFYIDIKYKHLIIESTPNDEFWSYILKDEIKNFSTIEDYYISKGGNIVAKKKTFEDGVIFWSWYTNQKIIDRISHHKFF